MKMIEYGRVCLFNDNTVVIVEIQDDKHVVVQAKEQRIFTSISKLVMQNEVLKDEDSIKKYLDNIKPMKKVVLTDFDRFKINLRNRVKESLLNKREVS